MNITGGFFGAFPASGGLSRSSVQANSGGKTQLVGLYSSLLILFILVLLAPLFEPLPNVSFSYNYPRTKALRGGRESLVSVVYACSLHLSRREPGYEATLTMYSKFIS